jgi:hypothetical protein
MKWARHVVRMREIRNAYKILTGKAEGKRLLERPKNRREYNIKMGRNGIWVWSGFIHLKIGGK